MDALPNVIFKKIQGHKISPQVSHCVTCHSDWLEAWILLNYLIGNGMHIAQDSCWEWRVMNNVNAVVALAVHD